MQRTPRRKIAFVSTMSSAPWGGSESLWSDAALKLRRDGHAVAANVCGWRQPPKAIETLRAAGVRIAERWFDLAHIRPWLLRRSCETAAKAIAPFLFERWLEREQPDLVCISNGCLRHDLRLIQVCMEARLPYVLVLHANAESMWPDDERASLLLAAYRGARRSFFVARANRELLETQLGAELANAEPVWNPFNVQRRAAGNWPGEADGLRLACVARLDPSSKGQDLLLRVLAGEAWRERPISVSFFGKGDNEDSLRRLARRLGIEKRIRFCGHVDNIDAVWASHHALVLPSRYEGLPISLIEALLWRRPAIVTDVGGNAEILDDGVTGFVASAPTVEHFSQAMERAWQGRAAWQAMGEAAARKVEALLPDDPGAAFAARLLELAAPQARVDEHAIAPAAWTWKRNLSLRSKP